VRTDSIIRAIHCLETSVYFNRLHGTISQKAVALLQTESESADVFKYREDTAKVFGTALLIALAVNWEDSVQAFCFKYKP